LDLAAPKRMDQILKEKKEKEVICQNTTSRQYQVTHLYANNGCSNNLKENISTTIARRLTARTTRRKKYFDYFVFKIVECGLPCSGARHHALAQTINNTRGFDINLPLSAENHLQDL
jgi:hypothetical protein